MRDIMTKKHHAPDYAKNKTADVIRKDWDRAVPNGQWQINMDLTPKGASDGWGAFLPRAGKDRPTPHTKTNECDH
jgi:hypothetical protein